jgi:hypothetical protein
MTRVTTESREDIENHDNPAINVRGGNRRYLRASPEQARTTDREEETEMAGQGTAIERQAANGDAVAAFGNGVVTLLIAVRQGTADTEAERRAQEDAAIDAEAILTQAAEANALDPVG